MITFTYDGHERLSWMGTLVSVLRERGMIGEYLEHHRWEDLPDQYRRHYPKDQTECLKDRAWFRQHTNKYSMHPAIRDAVLLSPPADWHRLVLEYPHKSQTDPARLAYTRDNRSGREDRQTVTTVGKYLARNFPLLSDHLIRDIAAQYIAHENVFKIVRTTDEIIDYLHRGPHSCMVWDDDEDDDPDRHPYAVYAPDLGWGLAVRMEGTRVNGRALVNDRHMCFVRTYRRNDDGYSHSDEALHSWLVSQGYTKKNGWPEGTELKYIPQRDRWGDRTFLAPYIDGSCQDVDTDEGKGVLYISDDGAYTCTNTDGYPTERETCSCDSCDARVREDDRYVVGMYEDTYICSDCFHDGYVHAYTERGRMRYLPERDCVQVGDSYYDTDYLEDNSIVELNDGEFEHIDNAICIDDVWYHVDDDIVVLLVDEDEYAVKDEGCWECDHSNVWYSDYITPIKLCDTEGNALRIHPDYVDQYEAELPEAADETLTIEGA